MQNVAIRPFDQHLSDKTAACIEHTTLAVQHKAEAALKIHATIEPLQHALESSHNVRGRLLPGVRAQEFNKKRTWCVNDQL